MCEAGLKTYETALKAMNKQHDPEMTETNETATDLMLSVYDLFGSYVGEMALSYVDGVTVDIDPDELCAGQALAQIDQISAEGATDFEYTVHRVE